MNIPLSSPDITEAEIEAVTSVLKTRSLSLGPRLVEFEEAFAAWVGTAHAVAVSSGTAGLHLAVRASGIGPGDEVITTPFSFVASVNAILYERAVPVFIDIDPVALNLDPARLETAITPRTRAILPVHLFGQPAPMTEVLAAARAGGLAVIEDACEAVGTYVGGRHAGALGNAGVFGFYPNKPITTGEGGMIVTDDGRLAALCRSLRNQGRDDDTFTHARLGYNYRLSELASALGLAQVRRLPSMLARREAVARAYDERLRDCPDLERPPLEVPGGRVGWFAYVVRLRSPRGESDRDRIVAAMRARGIGCQRYFAPLHLQPHVQAIRPHRRGDFPAAESAAARTIALPFFNALTAGQIDEVCATLTSLL
jgi:perosamine synthetase